MSVESLSATGVGAGGTTAPKGTQGDLLGVLADRSGFRDSRVIGVRGLPSVLPFLNALTFVDQPQVAGIVTCIHCGVCIWNCTHLDEDPAPNNIAFSAGVGGLHSTEN
jgi:hypothetical protein